MMNSQKAKIGPGFDTARPGPGKPKMIPGSLPKVLLRPKMGDPAVVMQRAQVPTMHPWGNPK